MTDERLTEEAAKRDALADAFDDTHRVTEGGCDTRGDDVAAMVLRLGFGRSEAPSADDIRVAVLHAVKKGARSDSEATRNYQEAERIIRAAIPHLLNTDAPTVHEVTPDEREALSEFLFTVYDHGTNPNALREADAILAFLARFRRSEAPEPSADDVVVTLTPEAVEANRQYIERTQGEPSDAQVEGLIKRAQNIVDTMKSSAGRRTRGDEWCYVRFGQLESLEVVLAALRVAGTVR